mgnify:CR=1 FL=1|jgi:hypothetical protein
MAIFYIKIFQSPYFNIQKQIESQLECIVIGGASLSSVYYIWAAAQQRRTERCTPFIMRVRRRNGQGRLIQHNTKSPAPILPRAVRPPGALMPSPCASRRRPPTSSRAWATRVNSSTNSSNSITMRASTADSLERTHTPAWASLPGQEAAIGDTPGAF